MMLPRMASVVGFVMVLSVSMGINIGLSQVIRTFPPVATWPTHLTGGVALKALSASSVDGQPVRLNFERQDGRSSILYVLAPQCPWCEKNFSNVAALARTVKDDYVVIGIVTSTDGLGQYLRKHAPPYPIYVVQAQDASTYGFGATPETIVVDRFGIVLRTWRGAYSGTRGQEIERYFGMRFR